MMCRCRSLFFICLIVTQCAMGGIPQKRPWYYSKYVAIGALVVVAGVLVGQQIQLAHLSGQLTEASGRAAREADVARRLDTLNQEIARLQAVGNQPVARLGDDQKAASVQCQKDIDNLYRGLAEIAGKIDGLSEGERRNTQGMEAIGERVNEARAELVQGLKNAKQVTDSLVVCVKEEDAKIKEIGAATAKSKKDIEVLQDKVRSIIKALPGTVRDFALLKEGLIS